MDKTCEIVIDMNEIFKDLIGVGIEKKEATRIVRSIDEIKLPEHLGGCFVSKEKFLDFGIIKELNEG